MLVDGTRLFRDSSINPAIVQTENPFGELVFADRAQSLPCQDVDLGIHVVNQRDQECLDSLGKNWSAELVLAMMGQDGVLQEQQGFLGEALDGCARSLSPGPDPSRRARSNDLPWCNGPRLDDIEVLEPFQCHAR